jgi:hypothetical protein
MERMTIRWRFHPVDERAQRWTRVHITDTAAVRTLCGRVIPALLRHLPSSSVYPYMVDKGDQVPADADRCGQCERRAGELTRPAPSSSPRRRGRPTNPNPTTNRTAALNVRLTADRREAVEAHARATNTSLADVVARMIDELVIRYGSAPCQ